MAHHKPAPFKSTASPSNPKHYDLIVIGGGPAGYVGAIRAAQLGMKVACVERDKLGGVCLNWGCIPTKALLANAELYEKIAHEADTWGLKVRDLSVDWAKVIGRSRDVAGKLNKGIEFLLRKNKIDHIKGNAKVVNGRKGNTPCRVDIHDAEVKDTLTHAPTTVGAKKDTLTATNVLICTGSVARELPFAKFDGDKIMGAREAMNTKDQPKSLIVIGAGAIGMEFAYFYHTYGTKVTVIEMLPRILPVEDDDISAALEKIYKKKGMDIRTGTTTLNVEKTGAGVKVTVAPFVNGKADESKKETIEADKVLLAIGVKGRYDGLFDASLGLETFKDHIKTDFKWGEQGDPAIDYKTNIPGLYAVGDIIGPPWLAHVASEEAIICVERLAGHDPIPMHYGVIPGCTYCHPQVASVGLTERALKEQGKVKDKDYAVGSYPLQAHGKAIASANNVGVVKILRGLPRGEILGAHILSDQATELIAELTLARRLEATTEELNVTVHAHPTMHEAIHEASLASEGRLIHG
ncbi:MAG: dihydrolipoyl dehydrogenase [Planctomycetes bacterium]|nr:dihydrolipoyl dehydrogenase [Planctomycetota bacterium]